LEEEMSVRKRRGSVSSQKFSEMLQKSIEAYRNKTITASVVIAELIELVKKIRAEDMRASNLGVSEEDLAFCDILAEAGVMRAEDDQKTLLKVAHELVELIKKDAKTDWTAKEQVRADLLMKIIFSLIRQGYPEDECDAVAEMIMSQAEMFPSLVGEGD
jgi:type I restriction enzyme R subunit